MGGQNTYVLALKLNGIHFNFINGGESPGFDKFAPSTSFVINCANQKEVDHYWNGLSKSGKPSQCGWVTDKYGVTWQVVPVGMFKYLGGPDAKGRERAVKTMLKMKKLDVGLLKKAYEDK